MESTKSNSILVTKPNLNQMKDAGMAFVLICLLVLAFTHSKPWLIAGIALLFIDMAYPRIFFIPAIFWFSLANLLGFVSSKVLLTLIFFLVITPVGLFRKLMGSARKDTRYDSLKLKQWKKSKESVFKTRNHKFSKKDMINPY